MSFFKAIWKGNLKHKKLYDEGTLTGAFDCEPVTEPSLEEVTFRAKYLGSTLVEKAASEEATAEAIKTILLLAKASGKKLQRVAVSLSLSGIKVRIVPTEDVHLDVSIYRGYLLMTGYLSDFFSVSYCSADAAHSQVFAFIATNSNETMECHAFLCRKRKTAQIMSLTLARVFRTAYDLLADGFQEDKFIMAGEGEKKTFQKDVLTHKNDFTQVETAMLIDFHSDLSQNRLGSWECFDDGTSNNLNYENLWNGSKKVHADSFEHNFFGGNVRWENSRTDLLCS